MNKKSSQIEEGIKIDEIPQIKSSKSFYIFMGADMTQFYIDGNRQNEKANIKQLDQHKQQIDDKQVNKQSKIQPQQIKIQKQGINRLDLQISKNKLNFQSVYGEIFIMLIDAELIGKQKKQIGKLLLTNYRFVFFKKYIKKLDLPFGFISQYKINQSQRNILLLLKWNISWKLKIIPAINNQLQIFQKFIQKYLQIANINQYFAFSYKKKYPNKISIQYLDILKQYQRINFHKYNQIYAIKNQFYLASTYPQIIFVPYQIHGNVVAKIARFWNYSRLPILTYLYPSNSKNMDNVAGLWRSSSIIDDKIDNLQEVIKYLKSINNNSKILQVFDAGSKKNKKGLQQCQIYSSCQIKYLQIFQLQNIKISYLSIIQCFLNSKKTFIKDLLASKWYDGVLQFLKGAYQISQKLQQQNNIIVKCQKGMDRSAVLAALVQIILDPYYRTYKGFAVLVQKQFNYLGHPFRSRLGFTSDKKEQIPIFIMFLDCVSQLIHTNQMCFQYNYKYLSNLSNLMYTCCFGTFITNNRRETIQNNIQKQTIPIWQQLISELTQNAFYKQSHGILSVPIKFDHLRIWKQHFWYLTSPPKESYQIHPLAQDNSDYISLLCMKTQYQKKQLQFQLEKQQIIIQQLQERIKNKKIILF